MSFPRYPAYKPSGVEWLEDVPEHWDIVRLKNVLECRITDGPHTTPEFIEEGIPFLSVDGIQGGELIFEGCRYISHEAHNEYRKKAQPEKNDILMGKAASTGKIARVKTEASFSIWSPLALIRIESRLSSPQFYEQVLKSAASQSQIDVLCTSNTQKNISMDDIPRLAMTKPPLEEQIAIASFLDRETAKIDDLIAEQKRLIELLQEKRQAVISHAVTKGLNPNARMKDSGVEWLGLVPEHWEKLRLKIVALKRCDGPFGSGLKSEHYVESGVFVVRLQNIKEAGLDSSSKAFIDTGYYQQELGDHDVVAGDLLIAGLGDENNPVGRACVAPAEIEPAMVKADCFRYRLDASLVNPDFAALSLNTSARYYGGKLSSGSTRARIPLSQMSEREIALPSLEEQTLIVEKLVTEMSAMDSLHRSANDAVVLLQERRSALISAAVTGQIDVRGLVPEVVEQ